MASIFSYETEPVQLSSPWPAKPTKHDDGPEIVPFSRAGEQRYSEEDLSEYGIQKLEAEPQEGPVEYKLHLLLRPRRSFSAMSTVHRVSGSHLSKSRTPSSKADGVAHSGSSTPVLAASGISRQNRLHHLTTQLLWRLQQSCPHHASSRTDLVLPLLPETDIQRSVERGPGKLLIGLEESLGALYEIGVSDDGTFVGLTQEELDESLVILRAMSYSLGCSLVVLRTVDVGECQWQEDTATDVGQVAPRRTERLKVAEVLVSPHVSSDLPRKPANLEQDYAEDMNSATEDLSDPIVTGPHQEQLRISLTGSTTSGKSSLLGSLSTSTLDNGRGKSRLSLLKHRHEIISGVTSSLAQELVGYRDCDLSCDDPSHHGHVQVVNYAAENVSSWGDIHHMSRPGRLVFLTDSAGHPRYRRTAVRGLVSWAPDWTLCCVAADEDEDSTGKSGASASARDILGPSGHGVDLSKVHLELCLKLDLPLVVIITKLDLTSKTGLRQTVAKILSILKEAGRKPVILPNGLDRGQQYPSQFLPSEDEESVKRVIGSCVGPEEIRHLVPIVLTSVKTGVGISKVHCLLRNLPIVPDMAESLDGQQMKDPPRLLFHVDEVFALPITDVSKVSDGAASMFDSILSGYLRYGSLEVGDTALIGPMIGEGETENLQGSSSPGLGLSSPNRGASSPGLGPSSPSRENSCSPRPGSYPGQQKLSGQTSRLLSMQRASAGTLGTLSTLTTGQDSMQAPRRYWHEVKIISIRYLRLPVRALSTGQAATLGVLFTRKVVDGRPNTGASAATSALVPSLRRGMVLLDNFVGSEDPSNMAYPPAFTSFAAVFKESNTYVIPGSSVIVYIASIRATAKIIEVRVADDHTFENDGESGDGVLSFDFEENHTESMMNDRNDARMHPVSMASQQKGPEAIEITFQFISPPREWIEIGTRVLVTPAGGLSMINPGLLPVHTFSSAGEERGSGDYSHAHPPPQQQQSNVSSSTSTANNLDNFVGIIVSASTS